MDNNFPNNEIMNDLNLAKRYRDQGEFGKSRVCARKAAGKAVKLILLRSNSDLPGSIDPYSALKLFQETLSEVDSLVPHLKNLQLRVDKEFNLPDGVDLISSAEFVINHCILKDQ